MRVGFYLETFANSKDPPLAEELEGGPASEDGTFSLRNPDPTEILPRLQDAT
jgi:hypothetical protein